MHGRDEKVSSTKLAVAQYAILVIFLVLGFRLAKLQVASSDEYETLAERNRIRSIPIIAPRGRMLDREGRVIVDNYPSFSILLLRDDAEQVERSLVEQALRRTRGNQTRASRLLGVVCVVAGLVLLRK